MIKAWIGIDFGGTNIRFATYLVESDTVVDVNKRKVQQQKDVETEIMKNIVHPISEIIKKHQKNGIKVTKIGISLAASFDRETGNITRWPNNSKWKDIPLVSILNKQFNLPVLLEDDANSAAMGELWKGAGASYHNMIYVTVSTGIGCGMVLNDKLIIGSNGWAGELGHIKASDNKEDVCTCGKFGCVQAIASGPAIVNTYNGLMTMKSIGKAKWANEIIDMAVKGSSTCVSILKRAGKILGESIGNLTILLDVSLIVLGGGVINEKNLYYQYIEEGIYSSLQEQKNVEIKISELPDLNGILGIFALMKDNG